MTTRYTPACDIYIYFEVYICERARDKKVSIIMCACVYMTALPCSTASRRSPKAPSLGSTAKDLEASPPPHSWPLSAHHLTSAPAGSPRHSECLARLFGRTSPIDERFISSLPVAKAAAAALVVAVAPLAVVVAAASRLDAAAAAAAAAAVVAAAAEARVVVLPAMAVGTLASDSVVLLPWWRRQRRLGQSRGHRWRRVGQRW